MYSLLDISIDEINLKPDLLKELVSIGVRSIGDLFKIPVKELKDKLNTNHDHIAKIRREAKNVADKYGFSFEKMSAKYGELLTVDAAFRRLGVHFDGELGQLILNTEPFNNAFLTVGEQITPPLSGTGNGNRVKTYAIFSRLQEHVNYIRENYASIVDLEKETGYSLKYYATNGQLDEARLTPTLWNRSWITENYSKIRFLSTSHTQKSYYDLLTSEQQRFIDSYLKHRQDYKISYRSETVHEFTTKDAHERHKQEITKYFFKIICSKCGINLEYDEKTRMLIEPDAEGMAKFDPTTLDINNLTSQDIKVIAEGLMPSTRSGIRKYIRAFVIYVLYRKRLGLEEEEFKTGVDDYQEWRKLDKWEDHILNAINTYLPSGGERKIENPFTSIFLKRRQMIGIYKILMENKDRIFRTPLKFTAMIMLSFFSAARPNELRQMKIERHLSIDKKTGLMDLIEIDGTKFGRIWITQDISKKGSSPSPHSGTLIPERLVNHMNLYLSWVYKKSPSTIGKGYVFRPDEHIPEKPYASSSTLYGWIRRYKANFLDYLSEEEISNFSSYDMRHTANNLIRRETVISSNVYLNDQKKNVAMWHVRHKPTDINDEHYTAKVELDVYAGVIKHAYDFPWDLEKLESWEAIMFGKEEEEVDHPIETLKKEVSPEEKVKIAEYDEIIKSLHVEAKNLTNHKYCQTHGIDNAQRAERYKEIQSQIQKINSERQTILEAI